MTDAIGYETDFGVISLSTKDLLEIPKAHRDFLLSASLIANDMKFHLSIMVRSPIDSENDDLRSMQMIRWLWASRKIASIIIEAYDTINVFIGKIESLKMLSKGEHPVLSKANKASKFIAVAREFRNKSAYHYDHTNLDAGLSDFDENAQHRIFVHKQVGNSISELAEQIHTIPTLKRISGSSNFDGFNTWCIECSRTIIQFCNAATAEIILANFPNRIHDMKAISIINEAEPQKHRWPLFWVNQT